MFFRKQPIKEFALTVQSCEQKGVRNPRLRMSRRAGFCQSSGAWTRQVSIEAQQPCYEKNGAAVQGLPLWIWN